MFSGKNIDNIHGYADAPDELKAQILFPAARVCLLKDNGLSRLKSVCKGWHQFLEKSDVPDEFLSLEIQEADYLEDSQMGEKLKARGWVKHLTIHDHEGSPGEMRQHFKNFLNIMLEGLQNKPNLKTFTWVGNLDVTFLFGLQKDTDMVFRKDDPPESGSPEPQSVPSARAYLNNPLHFVTLPHLKFFENLTTFKVTGEVCGDSHWDGFFRRYFMTFENFPKLQEYQYGNRPPIKRPQPQT